MDAMVIVPEIKIVLAQLAAAPQRIALASQGVDDLGLRSSPERDAWIGESPKWEVKHPDEKTL